MRLHHSGIVSFIWTLVAIAGAPAAASAQSGLASDWLDRPVAAQSQSPPPAVENRPVRRLSLDDAIELALEQNLGIQVERLNPQIQDYAVAEARSAWAPYVSSRFLTNSADNPANSFLSGGQERVSDDTFATNVSVTQTLPWGGNYAFSWDSSRSTTNNVFSNFDPTLRSNLDLQVVQPLLRNLRIDGNRQQLLVSRKNREMSDIELQQTVAGTIRLVRNAYWDLSYAVSSLEVQRQSLDLARESLRNNRTRVEIGTMAPIDIVEAEAEVARREEAVIVAEGEISRAEDRLKALTLDPATPDFWQLRLDLTDPPALDVLTVDLDAAVRNALDKRTDIRQARKQVETTEVNIRYHRNQTLPDVNAQVEYSLSGLGGTEFQRGPGFPGPIIGELDRGFGSVLGDLFDNRFPNWTLALVVGYPLGTSNAEANLARSRLQYSQTQARVRNLELQAATEVRQAGRQVMTNLKRVEASRAARVLSERRLEAEEKKFAAGMSTSFFVFQAQRDLAAARNDELRAQLDYSTSLTDFETVQEVPISGSGLSAAGGQSQTTGSVDFSTTGTGQGGGSGQP